MSLIDFTREFETLPVAEQNLFHEAVNRLVATGLIWREDAEARRVYGFLTRHGDLVQQFLAICGWEVVFHERVAVYQVKHADGAHRRHLNRKTTVWLLLLRLLYAEQRERLEASLNRYPLVTIGEIADRYAGYFPNQRVREKTSLDEALRTLQTLGLIRPAGGSGPVRAADPDRQIELLPTLEVVVPAGAIQELAERLSQYQTTPDQTETDQNGDEPEE